jgi:arginine repressor
LESYETNKQKEKSQLLDQIERKDCSLIEDWLYPTCGVKMIEIKMEKGRARRIGNEFKRVYRDTIIGTICGERNLILFVKENSEGMVLLEKL